MQASPSSPDLSLVILCYRAGASVRTFVAEAVRVFAEAGIKDYELILVGNYHPGIEDSTPGVVEELGRELPRVSSVALPKQGMMGWDMRTGMAQARGEYIAVIDGDGQMPLIDVVRVYRAIKQHKADIVKTYRVKRGDRVRRTILSWCYNFAFAVLFPGFDSRDINAKPKILSRAAYQRLDLRADDWFIDAEIMIQARRLKFSIREIPTVFMGLTGRRSFVRMPAVCEFIKNLIVYRVKEFF